MIDVGSNSVRLLVASVKAGGVRELHRDRVYVRLGDDAYALGRIGKAKLEESRRVAERFARVARKRGTERIETVVTAPGRQSANRNELVDVLADATQAPVVVLSADDEGRLAWEGAVARLEDPPELVAVVDLGGGSCELAVGRPGRGTDWVRSVDAGALRVSRAFLGGDPPSAKRIATAEREIAFLLESFDPPQPDTAVAVGGTARAIERILGRRYDTRELAALTAKLAKGTAARLTERYGITPGRAETLLGGTLVLAETARRLGSGVEVGRGGLREGAALALARAAAVAA